MPIKIKESDYDGKSKILKINKSNITGYQQPKKKLDSFDESLRKESYTKILRIF